MGGERWSGEHEPGRRRPPPVLRRSGGPGRGPPLPRERHRGAAGSPRSGSTPSRSTTTTSAAGRRSTTSTARSSRRCAGSSPTPGTTSRLLRQPQLAPVRRGHRHRDGPATGEERAGLRDQRLRRLLGVPAVPRGHRPCPGRGGRTARRRGPRARPDQAAPLLRPPAVRGRRRRRGARRAGDPRRRPRRPARSSPPTPSPCPPTRPPARPRRAATATPVRSARRPGWSRTELGVHRARPGLAVPVRTAADPLARPPDRGPPRRPGREGRHRCRREPDRLRLRPHRSRLRPRHRARRAGRRRSGCTWRGRRAPAPTPGSSA